MGVQVNQQPKLITSKRSRTINNRRSSTGKGRTLTKITPAKRNTRTKPSIKPRNPQTRSWSTQQLGLSLSNKLPFRSRKKDRSDAFRECIICAEMRPLGRNGTNFPIFPRCQHDPLTCSDCVSKHAVMTWKSRAPINHSKTADKGSIDSSVCTCPQCNILLTESEIRSVLSRTTNALITRKELESNPRWTWCLSITCSSGQIFPEGNRSQKVDCFKCGASSCFLHGVPWHYKYTCGQYADKHPNAKTLYSSEERIKRMTKKCPNSQCGWRIQKDGGCPHMRCTKCFQSFCWDDVNWDDNVTPEP
ncbi:hypothetical protein GX51_07695 [Blastomyces parvus]|uniref:RBR-type E3 ubiquitin transferase n=1 Tax=Blastomyces parvus TaxID=2060905 RepID=A0A2B7WJA7_9EURO|nr:hypothetical protein GX51_07695 [Blastomyces parvus]